MLDRIDNLPKTLLAFDFGMRRIGVAFGQTITGTATPLTTLKANVGVPNWDALKQLIKQWQPEALVIGNPLHIDGTELPITPAVQRFAQTLQLRYSLPIYHVDERFTTVEARQLLYDSGGFRKLQAAQVDSWAAKLILESWLASIKK